MPELRPPQPEGVASPAIAYVALGSNLGDRLDALDRARLAISHMAAVELLACSRLHESTAEVEACQQPDYLNAVLEIRTWLDAPTLWRELAAIEIRLGRERTVKAPKAPRTIDIDLIAHGDTRLSTPELSLPHPRWFSRGFVVYPLAEIGVRTLAGTSLESLLQKGLQPTRVTRLEWPSSNASSITNL